MLKYWLAEEKHMTISEEIAVLLTGVFCIAFAIALVIDRADVIGPLY